MNQFSKIEIKEGMHLPMLRHTEWEGQKREYFAQDVVVTLNDVETTIWEFPIDSPEAALPPGLYQLSLDSFQTKKFPNTKGDTGRYGVQRPEFKRLRLVPLATNKPAAK